MYCVRECVCVFVSIKTVFIIVVAKKHTGNLFFFVRVFFLFLFFFSKRLQGTPGSQPGMYTEQNRTLSEVLSVNLT